MKTTLIEHNNELYLVSDEEIKNAKQHEGEWHLEKGTILNKFPNYLTDLSECKLVLASQTSTERGLIIPPNLMEVLKGDNKEKRFTLEDMKLALLQAVVSAKSHIPRCKNVENIIEDVLTSFELKKEWKVEIERYLVGMNEGATHENHGEPKLTKNSEGKESYTITNLIS